MYYAKILIRQATWGGIGNLINIYKSLCVGVEDYRFDRSGCAYIVGWFPDCVIEGLRRSSPVASSISLLIPVSLDTELYDRMRRWRAFKQLTTGEPFRYFWEHPSWRGNEHLIPPQCWYPKESMIS